MSAVEHVRFVDCVRRDEGNRRDTIAVMWLAADPVARQIVYDRAGDVVERTGWYPLPQGHRLGSKRALRELELGFHHRAMPKFTVDGDLRTIENAVKPDGGCAIRVRTTRASLLLDTGLPGALDIAKSDRLVLLSHAHSDHSGAVITGVSADLPLILSLSTAQSLAVVGVSDIDEILKRCIAITAGQELPIGRGVRVRAFPVPHCPGSTGFELFDRTNALFYTGDVCLSTARHDFAAELVGRVRASHANRKTILIDATMASRSEGASREDAANELLRRADTMEDIVLVSADASQLIYAYLDLFFIATRTAALRHRLAFLMTAGARRLFEILHAAFIDRRLGEVDPFIASQYGASMSAWGESRWLYWLDQLRSMPAETPRFWFVDQTELHQLRLGAGGVGAVIGRRPPELQFPESIEEIDLDTSPWTQHSDSPSLAHTIRELSALGDVVLFHAFRRQLEKFIESRQLRARVLGPDPIHL
jgi:glyoxylase-like metal-dependent hydrolase (beta-lactamase superfamily II)